MSARKLDKLSAEPPDGSHLLIGFRQEGPLPREIQGQTRGADPTVSCLSSRSARLAVPHLHSVVRRALGRSVPSLCQENSNFAMTVAIGICSCFTQTTAPRVVTCSSISFIFAAEIPSSPSAASLSPLGSSCSANANAAA